MIHALQGLVAGGTVRAMAKFWTAGVLERVFYGEEANDFFCVLRCSLHVATSPLIFSAPPIIHTSSYT